MCMKAPYPIITTAKQSLLTKCKYMVADRDNILRDYRTRVLGDADGQRYQLSGMAYGALQ